MSSGGDPIDPGAEGEGGPFRELAQVSLHAQAVHRRFQPLWVNGAFADLFHFDAPAEVLTRASIADLLDDAVSADPEAAWEKLRAGVCTFGRRTLRRRGGAPFRAEIYTRRIEWRDAPAAAIAILDVSEEERAIHDLAAARADAHGAANAHRHLLRAASEDLRPVLVAAIDQLSCTPHNASALEAHSACRRLLQRVEENVRASSAETDAAPLRAAFDVAALLADAIHELASEPGAPRVSMHRTAPPTARLIGDPARVRMLVRTLIAASAARAADAPIVLDAEISLAGLALTARVAGAPPALRSADPLRAARPLAQAMGGVLTERRDETGAWIATAYLPLPSAPLEGEGPARDILVVDDSLGARRMIGAILEALGHRPMLTASGAEALAALMARPYDLALLDLHLPVMDGFEIARRIRALPRPWACLPIAALSAAEGAAAQADAAEAGMDAFLKKPASVRRLAETVALLTASIEPAELDEVQKEQDHEKSEDCVDRQHARAPAFRQRRL